MTSLIKRVVLVAALIVMFAVATAQTPPAYSSESTAEDKVSDFLSSVVGLDLTKYTLVQPSIPSYSEDSPNLSESLTYQNLTLNDQFGGLVEQETLSYDFEYNGSSIDTMSVFYNGHMAFLKIYSYSECDYVYSESPPTGILDHTKSILQRYQTFTLHNYATDTSYIVPMLNVLSNISDLSPATITNGNVTFQVSEDGDRTRIQWIYTQDGVSMTWKRMDIEFCNNTLESFRDTWGLYSVSGLSEISSEEAFQIALEAAQNYEIRVGYDDGETEIVKVPDLSNAPYTVSFTMVPFRFLDYQIHSNMSRDPLTLYPYWQIHFYFNESIAGNTGIQVGVWGDTGEILYCSGFGYFGVSGTTNEQDTTEQTPDNQILDEQEQNNLLNPSTLVAAVSLAAVPIVSMSVIVLRRKNRHKNRI
jgi:hypothetical protein